MPELHLVVRQPDVSKVIGKGGVNIKGLEKETNTRINLQDDSGMLERDFTKLRNFRVQGKQEDLVKGLVKIVAGTLTQEYDSPFLQMLLLPGRESQFSRRRDLMGDSELSKELAKLNEEMSARIKVVNLGSIGVLGIEILSTTEDEMEEALDKVIELLKSEGVIENTKVGDRQEMVKLTKSTIEEQVDALTSTEIAAFLIPEDKTSLLIGPKGATIKELEEMHNVKLKAEKPGSPYFLTGRTVLVRGEVQNIGECLAAVSDKIFEKDNLEPRVVCLLPPGVSKYLIGRSGENIKRMEKETGCSLKVERADMRYGVLTGDDEWQYCQIKGTRDTIVKGILGVVARILIQLSFDGETSDATVPPLCDFGGFGNFGHVELKRAAVGGRSNIQGSRLVQGTFALNQARLPASRIWNSQAGRGFVGVRAGPRLDIPADRSWSARLSQDRRQHSGDFLELRGANRTRQSATPAALRTGAWYAGSGSGGVAEVFNGGDRGYGTARGMVPQQHQRRRNAAFY